MGRMFESNTDNRMRISLLFVVKKCGLVQCEINYVVSACFASRWFTTSGEMLLPAIIQDWLQSVICHFIFSPFRFHHFAALFRSRAREKKGKTSRRAKCTSLSLLIRSIFCSLIRGHHFRPSVQYKINISTNSCMMTSWPFARLTQKCAPNLTNEFHKFTIFCCDWSFAFTCSYRSVVTLKIREIQFIGSEFSGSLPFATTRLNGWFSFLCTLFSRGFWSLSTFYS